MIAYLIAKLAVALATLAFQAALVGVAAVVAGCMAAEAIGAWRRKRNHRLRVELHRATAQQLRRHLLLCEQGEPWALDAIGAITRAITDRDYSRIG